MTYLVDDKFEDFKNYIILVSKEKKKYKISKQAKNLSDMLKAQLDGYDDSEDDKIELPIEYEGSVIDIFIKYVEYHKDNKPDDIPQPLDKPFNEYICKWDQDFISEHLVINNNEKNHEMLQKVCEISHYFDCKWLFNLTCAKIGSMIKDKSPEEIRTLFDIKDDRSEEQKKQDEEELKALS